MTFTLRHANWLIRGIFTATVALWATAHGADVAFMQVGENGELSFSDIASPNATEIPLATFATPALNTDEHIAQMLKVAEELARARQQREAQRAAAKTARLQGSAQNQAQYSSPASTLRREVYLHPGYYPRWPHRHQHRPPRQKPHDTLQNHADSPDRMYSPLKVQ